MLSKIQLGIIFINRKYTSIKEKVFIRRNILACHTHARSIMLVINEEHIRTTFSALRRMSFKVNASIM